MGAQRLPLPTQSIKGSGLLWLEVERDGVLSKPVPVVVSTDMDVVEEISDLDDEISMGRCFLQIALLSCVLDMAAWYMQAHAQSNRICWS